MRVRVAQGSLTDGAETVLVNASNTQLRLGSGVSAAIRRACGPGFQEQLDEILAAHGGAFEPGSVVATGAGAHPNAKHVVHVAVMDYRDGVSAKSFPSLDRLRLACESLWEVVAGLPASPLTVAMVALGAGTGRLGLSDSVQVACETLVAFRAIHTESRLEGVTFYGFELHEYVATARVVAKHFPEVLDDLSEAVRALVTSPD